MPRNSRCFAVVVCLVLCFSSLLFAQSTDQPAAAKVVTAMDSGVAFHVGQFDIAISGEINGFYVHDRADNTAHWMAGCALCSASSGAQPSSSIRNGLLPGDLSFKISTREYGWDTAVFFGIWPEIQSIAPSTAFGSTVSVNVGRNGAPNALGTAGIDFRQQFVTFGRPHFGTVKIGRDLGLFGQEAILNDFTILGCRHTERQHRAGQRHAGPHWRGLHLHRLPPPDQLHDAHGWRPAGCIRGHPAPGRYHCRVCWRANPALNGHGQPQFQGKLTYKVPGKGKTKANFWANFLTQSMEAEQHRAALAAAPI